MMNTISKGETLEQQRAQDAWNKCKGYGDDYKKLAKGLPALIMNSGLMQVMAFLHEKKGTHEQLSTHLRQWLAQRFPGTFTETNFESFMQALLEAKPDQYRAITTESFNWLRWLRQMASARIGAD